MDIFDAINELKKSSEIGDVSASTYQTIRRFVLNENEISYSEEQINEIKGFLNNLLNRNVISNEAYDVLITKVERYQADNRHKYKGRECYSSTYAIDVFKGPLFGFLWTFFFSLVGFVLVMVFGDDGSKKSAIITMCVSAAFSILAIIISIVLN